MERELTRQIFLKLGHQRLISSQGKISSHTRSVLIVTYQGHLSQYLPLGRYTGYGTCWRLLTTGFHTNRFQLKSWLVSDFHLSPSPSLPYKLASGIVAEHSMCPVLMLSIPCVLDVCHFTGSMEGWIVPESQGQQVSTSLCGLKAVAISQLMLLSFSFLKSGMGRLALACPWTILNLRFPFLSGLDRGYKTMSVKTLCAKTSSNQRRSRFLQFCLSVTK